MKQRLLLALLVLFASVGMVKADAGNGTVTLTIPKGKTVTISVNESAGIATTTGNQASFTISKSFTIKAAEEFKDAETYTASFYSGSYSSLTIGAGATQIVFDAGSYDWSSLKTLKIQKGEVSGLALGTTLHPLLTSLTIEENKLLKVPAKGEKMTTYAITTQIPDLPLATNGWVPANKTLSPTLDMLLGSGHGYTGNFELLDWSGKDAAGNTLSSSTVHKGSKDLNTYYFYTGPQEPFQENSCTYVDGDYTCTLHFTDGNWKGVKIKGVKVKVLPAEYTMDKPVVLPEGTENTLAISENNETKFSGSIETVKKGTTFTVKANPAKGYSFNKAGFVATGLDIDQDPKDNLLYTIKVNGKAQPSLKATFTAEGQTITIQKPTNGNISVWNGNDEIETGESVATGTKLTIKVSPVTGYQLDKFMINGQEQTNKKIDGSISIFEYTVTAEYEAIIMSASFKEAALSLKIQWTQAHMTEVKLNVGTETGTSDNGSYSKIFDVPYGDKPTISFTTNSGFYITSIIANNEPVPYTVIKKQEGANGTSYQITEFDMKSVPVTMVVNTSDKSKAKIIVDFKDVNDGTYIGTPLVYDGDVKEIPYETNPSNLSNVVVKYYIGDNISTATTTGYKDAGTYKAVFSREADDVYAEATVVNKSGAEKTNGTIVYTIDPATPIITTDPQVTINKETGEYTVTAGVAQYAKGNQKVTIPKEKCVWEVVLNTDIENGTAVKKTSQTKGDKGYPSEVVTVRLHIKKTSEDWSKDSNMDKNFKEYASVEVKAKGQVDELKEVNVYILEKMMPEGTKLTLRNGNKNLGTSAKVLTGTHINFDVDPGRYNSSQWGVYHVDKQGNKIKPNTDDPKDINTEGIDAAGSEMYFLLIPNTKLDDLIELELISAKDEIAGNHPYNGKVQTFNTSVIRVKNKATGKEIESTIVNALWSNAAITYKDPAGKETTAPINAGTYTVTIKRPADNTYKEFTATGTMLVEQAMPEIVTWPNSDPDGTPAYIGKGSALSTAVLTGGVSSVKGSFEWVSPNTIVEVDGNYDVKFVSQDSNYKDVSSSADNKTAYVKITNETILSIAKDDTYTITAKGSDNKEYKNGMTVPVGTTLTFTVTPAATYKLKTLYVNGKAISGNTYKTTAGPISVKAEMTQEFTVAVTKPSKGIIVTLPSSNKVKAGESYIFTVAALAADMSKIVVKDGSTTVAGSNGKYTISNITADKAITITLDNPTAITVKADTTMSPGHKPMDEITVEGVTNGKCYYGDKVTVKAEPVQGVTFVGWTGTTETTSTFSFIAKEASYHFKAKYSGSPVGIEAIEGVKIYGTKGAIVINCDSDASVIIISMNGQSRQVEISGDTRIPAGAGIYGVVFQKGAERIQTKVMVR